MRIAFVTDPLDSLDPATDTSIGLMHAAQQRGAEVWATEAHLLEAVGHRPRARARRLRLAEHGPEPAAARPWYRAGEPQNVRLDEMAAVFMRTEPPVDGTYLAAAFVLDLVDPDRTALVNDPRGLRLCSEHLFPLRFPDLTPPTTVTADPAAVRAFLRSHGTAVLKPVDGYAGRGVLRLDEHDPNLASLLELGTRNGTRAVVAQAFLPEVADGNKRIFLVDGEPVAAVHRYPADGDFRIGPPGAEAALTARDRQICARIGPELRRLGLRTAGLDVIGRHLIEVNVTSPGALRKADTLLGWSLCADLLDTVLRTPCPKEPPTCPSPSPAPPSSARCSSSSA
ncbi:glutathione synthase [Kitasatospora sp. KL5]|uniref:glutathione synthase n=1 Tax=Kitasatospora sp. KL5 TaxID=3425125 RepID=UPI003D6DADD9